MADDQIKREWRRIIRLAQSGKSLSLRVAHAYADRLEAAGVSETDIDRLFPA
jgi:hypothetical protein